MCRVAVVVASVACVLALAPDASAERLAARVYTTADGLSTDRVDRGTRDPRGFLWFATGEGVSRFDGQRFERFGAADGLPSAHVLDILASSDGMIWAATDAGLAWLDPTTPMAHARFQLVGPHTIAFTAHEDAHGTVWAGTSDGLAVVHRPHAPIGWEPVKLAERTPQIYSIADDARDGTLWLATWAGLWSRTADGHVEQYRVTTPGERDDRLSSVLIDRHHNVWITHVGPKIIRITPHPGQRLIPDGQSLWEAAAAGGDLLRYLPPGQTRRSMLEDVRGVIWIGTAHGLVTFDGAAFHVLPAGTLPIDDTLAPCVEDIDGNLWLGSDARGLVRYAPNGFTAFDHRDGIESDYVHGFVEPRGGPVYAVTWDMGHILSRFDGTRFQALRPKPPEGVTTMAWSAGQTAFIDHTGAWWYPTGEGVARYAANLPFEQLATTVPEWFARPPLLPGRDIFHLYEDRRGDVWISTLSGTGLVRWARSDQTIHPVPGLPVGVASSFLEDRAGAMWIGYEGELVRIRAGASPELFGAREGVPAGTNLGLIEDRDGRVWITGEGGGVAHIDEPAAAQVRLVPFTTANGLASNQALSLVEDGFGQIYIGTTHGIDRISPGALGSAPIAHFGIADGLPNENVPVSHRDRTGALWFGTKNGIARLVPQRPAVGAPPRTYVSRVSIDGKALDMAVDGMQVIELELGASADRLDIAFTSPVFAVGDPVRFQYELDDTWSEPVVEREVHYARLAPGQYQFRVRAVAASGAVSEPATVSFVVVPPVWTRWWFLTLCAIALALIGFVIARARLRHVLAIERIRTRIATDLHDDLGANLSRISILADVATRRAAADQPHLEQVTDIGRSARELVEVASDIVWSTDPRRDDLGSLLVRLRKFAGDVLEARNIAWMLTAPSEPDRIKLTPDQRRHLHLIVKEAVNNAAKHSEAKAVTIDVTRVDRALVVKISDDGRGFELRTMGGEGNGLTNMQNRARVAGGTLVLSSQVGEGTTITLRLPLRGA